MCVRLDVGNYILASKEAEKQNNLKNVHDRVHDGFGYGVRNNAETEFLDFAVAYE